MRKLIAPFVLLASVSFANINEDFDDCRRSGGDCVNEILQKLSVNVEMPQVTSCVAFDHRASGKVECCQIECHNSKQAVCRDSIYSNDPRLCKLANCACEVR